MDPRRLAVTDLESGTSKTVPLGPEHAGPSRFFAIEQTRRGLRVAVWVGKAAVDLPDETGPRVCRVEVPQAEEPVFVDVSPDATRLACHWPDGKWARLAVFDAASGKQLTRCDGHRDGLWALTFSPDDTLHASAGEDWTARVWDRATGALLATCRGHTSKILGAAFRPDGARLVTSSADGTVRQWDTATGREVEPAYDRHTGEVAVAVHSPDEQLVASARTDRAGLQPRRPLAGCSGDRREHGGPPGCADAHGGGALPGP
jgi:WD40 repeat protein